MLDDTGVTFVAFNPLIFVVGAIVVVLAAQWLLKRLLRAMQRPTGGASVGGHRAHSATGHGPRVKSSGTFGEGRYRTTHGLRLLALAGIGAILWLLRPALTDEAAGRFGEVNGFLRIEGLALSGPYAWPIFAALALLGFLYLHYLWTYEVVIDGPHLTYSRPGFAWRSHDLRQLERIEDGGARNLTLYFENGKRGSVIKQVGDMTDMVARLNAYRTPTRA